MPSRPCSTTRVLERGAALPQLARALTEDGGTANAAGRVGSTRVGGVPDATLYVFFERARTASRKPNCRAAARDYIPAAEALNLPLPALVPPKTLVDALASALGNARDDGVRGGVPPVGSLHAVTFRHSLGSPTRRAPVQRGSASARRLRKHGDGHGRCDGATGGVVSPNYRSDSWDRMVVSNAPGRSGSPSSPHFSDLVRQDMWSCRSALARSAPLLKRR